MEEKSRGAMRFNELVAGVTGDLSVYQAAKSVLACNEKSGDYLLTLTEEQAREIVEHKNTAAKENGLIELKGGVVPQIIDSFCDSAYLDSYNYVSSLKTFTTVFLRIRNELPGTVADEEIIYCLRTDFDRYCGGDIYCLESVCGPNIISFFNLHNSLKNYVHLPPWEEDASDEEDEYE